MLAFNSLSRQLTRLSLAIISLASILSSSPAHALTETQQDAAIANLQSALTKLQSTVNSQQTTAEKLQNTVTSQTTTLTSLQSTINTQQTAMTKLQNTVNTQQTTITALNAKLQFVTTSGHDLTLTGNLHVISGAGHTNAAPNGLGNVIIGYNEASTTANKRTGSHNLIIGTQNNYTSYGGIVAGQGNTIAGIYASVTGGSGNIALGPDSSISGGFTNTASSNYASVSGGRNNVAQSAWSYVGGGLGNTSSANYAAVGGGNGFAAKTMFAFLPTSISQESLQSLQTQINTVQTTASRVSGLFTFSTDPTRDDHMQNTEVTMKGINLHIVNGLGTTNGNISDPTSTSNAEVNGLGNLIIGYDELPGDPTFAHFGSHNLVLGTRNAYKSFGGIVAGINNTISGAYATVTGGQQNEAAGVTASICGGEINSSRGESSSISGGNFNIARGAEASVGGGAGNEANADHSTVSGGDDMDENVFGGWIGGAFRTPEGE